MPFIELQAPSGNATPLIVKTLLSAREGDVIHLNGGIWHFYSDGCHEQYFAPSNNANGLKKIAFPMIGLKNVTLDGGGAHLLFHSRLFPFIISGCEGIRIENLTIDFSFPRYAVAELIESDEQGFSLHVDEALYPWRTENGHWEFQAGSDVRSTAEKKFFLSGDGFCCYIVAGDTRDPLFNLAAPLLRCDARRTREGVVRFDYRADSARLKAQIGQSIIVSNDENRENDVFFIENSACLSVRSVEIVRGAGMGFIGQLSRDLLFEDVSIHVSDKRSEPHAITADAFHFINCDGTLVIRRCAVSDSLDDAINIHGIYTRVTAVQPNLLTAALGHQEQYGFNPYRPGDRLRVTHDDGSAQFGALTVLESRLSEDEKQLFVRYEAPEGTLQAGDYLDCPERSPELLIEDSSFVRCPRVLLSSNRKTIVRRNRFALRGAVTVMDGMAYWYESGLSTDLLIEGNTFDHSGSGGSAIAARLDSAHPTQRMHKNVRIIGNKIIGTDTLLHASHVDGLTISGNTLTDSAGEIRLDSCRRVVIN